MQRRRFLAMLSLAPVALVAAKTTALCDIFKEPIKMTWVPTTQTLTWTPCRMFEVGDVVTLSGFTNGDNGTYRMNRQREFERIA